MNKKIIINLLISLIVIIFVLSGAYFYYRIFRLKDSNQFNNKETKYLITNVSKLYLLPVDEIPTIATVSDPEVLKNNPFFINAEKGDKVLIYTKAKKAILYRPTINKIIDTTSTIVDTSTSIGSK